MDGGAGTGNPVLGGVRRRQPTKKKKPPAMKKPIKVVYISNPMKIQTSASEFMALVQELTGQDADFPDPSKFPAVVGGSDGSGALHKTPADVGGVDDGDNNLPTLAVELPAEDVTAAAAVAVAAAAAGECSDESFYDAFDDLFLPPVIGSFSGLLPTAAVLYESYARWSPSNLIFHDVKNRS